ncbi:hypothetical protein [Nitrosomonas ureae]|uniref:Uncharacterized protein n=1 Tax=Nitrosomonas ureae TaxID=44577 RepID=A0A286AJV7_9PROT|nr:hypothetical protein [Nitrosomonas ureae]SOD22166.1 hypothetical protein SAMN06297164_3374 [Nitrosomonas ureae]
MINERIRQTGQMIQVKPELLEIGYYAPFSNEIDSIMENLTQKDTHKPFPNALTATLAEKVMHYFAHAENKAYPSNGIGQLQKQPVMVKDLAYCGKESQTLYSYSEDGESNGTTLIGEKEAQIFQLGAPESLTVWLSGQQVSYSMVELYTRLFQRVCNERKLSLENFNDSIFESRFCC